MRTIFIYIALLTSFLGFSQTTFPIEEIKYSPSGVFDTVFDNDGNKFLLKDIVISNDSTKVVSFNDCNSGYFKLYFEIGSGFEQSNSIHQQRRNVLCQLFYDLSQFITPVNPNTPVNIYVRSFVNELVSPPSGVGAYASSVYLAPAITTNIGGGIVDNAIWQTINSGIDPFIAFNPPISNLNSASAGFYHGIIAFNFNIPGVSWHQSLSPCPSTLLDLYSIGLHEITHALGFASLINGNGESKFGNYYPYFSRYDKFLQTTSGANLLTNTGACSSMYGFGFNPNLNLSILINNGTVCTTPNLIKFGGSVNQNVYTFPAIIPPNPNPQFEPGSALSHFEDQCHSPNTYPDNSYYVMSNGSFIPNSNPPLFYSKRYLKDEERKVLCDIGYKVTNVFGGYTYPNTTQCGGNQIVGVNDGITYNPSANTYTYVIANNSLTPLTISNFLLNDYNPNSSLTLTFECPRSVFGYGTATLVNGNTISYTPNGTGDGLDLIRYVPILQNGQKGNITYIYVYVTTASCGVNGACESYVNNGNFEQCSGCGSLSGNYPTLINPCWNKFSDTPDIWSLANPACQAVQYTYPQPLVNSWNSLNSNTHFLGLNSSKGFYIDGFQNNLTSPLVPTMGYYVKFKAKVSNHIPSQNNSSFVAIGGSTASTPISSPYYTSFPPPIQNLGSVLISGNNWQDYQIHIPNTLITSNINYLTIINAIYLSPNFSSYLMIDDITIVEENANYYFTPPSIVCANDPIDLNIYTNVPNCIFTINGVVGSVFNPAILGLGNHNVTCTYTKPNGCIVTFLATIEYKNPTISPLFNQIAPICIGSNTNPLPNTSLNGITGTWSPTFNNSATTTYTFTPSTGFCATTTTMTIQVSSGCCVTPIATYNNQINASVLASITSGQTVEINSNVIVSTNSTFNGIKFRLGSNVKIIVNPGITLNLTNCTLYSCTSMWDGIEILAGGVLNLNGTRIEDAKEGVLSLSNASLTVNNCNFNKNKTAIRLENWNNFNGVNGTTFDCSTTNSPTPFGYLKAPFEGEKSFYGIYLSGMNTATIGGTTENLFTNLEIGIYVRKSLNVSILKNKFTNINTLCPIANVCTNATVKGWGIFTDDIQNLSIGHTSNSLLGNIFSNSYNGILVNNCQKFAIHRNTFNDILNSIPSAFGIYFCIYIGNYGSTNGVVGYDNFIQNNTFTNFNRGIYYTNNYSNSLTISQNKMSTFNATSSSGINIFENSRPQTILIEKNIFNDQTNQLGQVAINIQRVGAIDGSNITIKRNTIRNVKNGIRITSHHNVKIIENSSNFTSIGTTKAGIYFPTSVPTSLTTGIKLEDCKGTLVKSNTIQRTNYTTSPFNGYSELTNTQALDMVGIYVGENCFNTSVIDNSALKLGTGIYFIGNNNSPITLRCNFMKFNPTGLHMNGFIGDQGSLTSPQDNQWSIVTPGAKGIIRNGSTPKFFTRSYSMPFMPSPGSQFEPPNTAITINNASGGYSCVEGCANPPCALPGGLLQAITTTGEYVLLSEQELKTLDIELYKSLKITSYTYDEYSEEGEKYQEFMDSMDMTNANKIYELEEELATKDTISAQQKLDAFEAYGDVELNYKKVFEVYINSWMKGKYELESQDSSYLREIADQSPRVAGNAVYMARVMLSIDTIDTETYSAKSMTQSNNLLFEQLKLYPNPGSEFIHYQLPILENEKGIVRIIDVSGKVIDEWFVDNEKTIGSVDVSQYSKGIYLFDLQITNGKSIVKKMVVK